MRFTTSKASNVTCFNLIFNFQIQQPKKYVNILLLHSVSLCFLNTPLFFKKYQMQPLQNPAWHFFYSGSYTVRNRTVRAFRADRGAKLVHTWNIFEIASPIQLGAQLPPSPLQLSTQSPPLFCWELESSTTLFVDQAEERLKGGETRCPETKVSF